MTLYRVEVEMSPDRWGLVFEQGRSFCLGYLACHREQSGPSLAMRVCKADGNVIDSHAARTEVSIGMIAGMPSPEQYEDAAARALEIAAMIRKHRAGEQARRDAARGGP